MFTLMFAQSAVEDGSGGSNPVRSVLFALFWLWLAVSIAVYAYRGYRRISEGPKSEREGKDSAETPLAGSAGPSKLPPVSSPVPTLSSLPPEGPDVGSSTQTPSSTPPERPTPSTQTAGSSRAASSGAATGEPDPRPLPAPSGGTEGSRSGFFAPSGAPSSSGSVGDTTRQPVAVLLKGITMPADLAPIMGGPDSVQKAAGLLVAFSTNAFSPPEVGRQVGDELERLGYAVSSLTDTQVEAVRDDDRLIVSLIIDPGEVIRDGQKAFPTLPPNSVVVEFESA